MQRSLFTKNTGDLGQLTEEHGAWLCRYARACVGEALGGPRAERPEGAWAEREAATFVTLRRGGELHGCIGTLEPRRRLADDVAHNAVAAALKDPRARAIEVGDVARLSVEISLLSAIEPVAASTEEEALAALRPGVDGVVLRYRALAATFLPQVWSSLPEPASFLRELKRKAGLPRDFWAEGVMLSRYTNTKWEDEPAREGDS